MMCGEVQSEGAFDEGNARVSCSESSTSTKRRLRGRHMEGQGNQCANRAQIFCFSVYGLLTSVYGHCSGNLTSVCGHCSGNILLSVIG